MQLLLLGSNFSLSPRIEEGPKGSLKAILILKIQTERSTTSTLFSCDDSRDIFLLSFLLLHGRLRSRNLTSNFNPSQ